MKLFTRLFETSAERVARERDERLMAEREKQRLKKLEATRLAHAQRQERLDTRVSEVMWHNTVQGD